MSNDAPDWIAWQPARWIVGTAEMDAMTEFVFFRLCMVAYEAGDPHIRGSARRNSMRCKVDVETFEVAIEVLVELEKVQVIEGGLFIPSTAKRLRDSLSRIEGRRRGAAIARRRRELKNSGTSEKEISLIISREFPDDQSDDQSDITNKQTEQTEQTDTQGGEGGEELQLFPADETPDDIEIAFDLWNELAERTDLSRCSSRNDKRRKAIKLRLEEAGGLEGWKFALSKIEANSFLLGQNDNGWRASLDFLLQPSSFAKVIEGQYDRAEKKSSAQAALERMNK